HSTLAESAQVVSTAHWVLPGWQMPFLSIATVTPAGGLPSGPSGTQSSPVPGTPSSTMPLQSSSTPLQVSVERLTSPTHSFLSPASPITPGCEVSCPLLFTHSFLPGAHAAAWQTLSLMKTVPQAPPTSTGMSSMSPLQLSSL